ncbi:MAG: hypothetical protein HC869_12975 [Rhodospirillales bacterium]|nr:hypothetical protein [Rhodospirillales bacterium]
MHGAVNRSVLGFIAAAIAVVTVHEGIIYALTQSGWMRGTAWSMQPIPPWGVPRLVNAMFWGASGGTVRRDL